MGGNDNEKEKKDKNNENNKPKQKKKRRGKKEKQGEQTGNVVDTIAAAVVKPGTAPPKPAATPTPKGYCFWCGEEGHSAKQCTHTGDLTCPLHPGSVSHMQSLLKLEEAAKSVGASHDAEAQGQPGGGGHSRGCVQYKSQ